MGRKYVDCREIPSEKNCSLYISGTEDEVVAAATEHAVSAHGHEDTPEFREEIRKALKEETALVGSAK
jgi:predicted small metal-binding protein